MPINTHKSCCLRIGPRFKASCANICSINGRAIGWSSEIKYLGIFIVSAGVFRCSFCKAKQSFYRSFNAVFGKIGRIATADVIIQLLKMKCLPAMLYGVEVCALKKSQAESLQFAVNSSFMKIFNTKSMNLSVNVWICLM